jgi:hypothetical protein
MQFSAGLKGTQVGVVLMEIWQMWISICRFGITAVFGDPHQDHSFLAFRNSGFKALDSRR